MPTRSCVVFVPAQNGNGTFTYHTTAESSFSAAWEALQKHEASRKTKVPDDTVLHVVIGDKD